MAYHKMLPRTKTRDNTTKVSLLRRSRTLPDGPIHFSSSSGWVIAFAKFHRRAENELVFKEGQRVRTNLAGMQAGGVLFHAAVTDAVGNIVRQTSENPPVYLVRLLFSFKGVNEVEVPAERITAF